jgi:hypothetical protein
MKLYFFYTRILVCLLWVLLVSAPSSAANFNQSKKKQAQEGVGPVEVLVDANTVRLRFDFSHIKQNCGIAITWGDGRNQNLRVGKDVSKRFTAEHRYKSDGVYPIKIVGKAMTRGLGSVSRCEGKESLIAINIDNKERKKQEALAKAAQEELERQVREKKESERQAREKEARERQTQNLVRQWELDKKRADPAVSGSLRPALDPSDYEELKRSDPIFLQIVGMVEEKNPDVVPYLRMRAEKGDPFSQLLLGLVLEQAWQGTKDEESACFWYGEAAGAGVSSARWVLANRAFKNPGNCFRTDPSIEDALGWARLAGQSQDKDVSDGAKKLQAEIEAVLGR